MLRLILKDLEAVLSLVKKLLSNLCFCSLKSDRLVIGSCQWAVNWTVAIACQAS